MYGIVLCPKCGRKRIADLKCETSVCPYCNSSSVASKMTVLFSDKSQSMVRRVFESADSSKYPEPRKKSATDPDPLSTLVYEYEHTSGTLEKLMVIANGLTRIKGSFTEDDVEELFPGKGEHMIGMMVSQGLIIESSFGNYVKV